MATKKSIRCKYDRLYRLTITRTDEEVRFADPNSGKACTRKAWVCGFNKYVYLHGTYYRLSNAVVNGMHHPVSEYEEARF